MYNRKGNNVNPDFPNKVFVVRDIHGKLHISEELENIEVYYHDKQGILCGVYVLHDFGLVRKEIKFDLNKETK